MCLGEIARLLEAWEDGSARLGRLADEVATEALTLRTGATPTDVHGGSP